MNNMTLKERWLRHVFGIGLACLALPLWAQAPGRDFTFDSTSDETDGVLAFTMPGDYVFDPESYSPALDPDGDGVFHFTSINIAAGVTLRLKADVMGTRPVVWLATGNVDIHGELVLNGENGHNTDQMVRASVAGAGGFGGGLGRTSTSGSTAGNGPGAGMPSETNGSGEAGGGAGHRGNGGNGEPGPGGVAYGNNYLLPMIGGSGGAGGGRTSSDRGGGGGAGGGAILIASSSEIVIEGAIRANGGNGGAHVSDLFYGGGGGSGGAIRLIAPEIRGGGTLQTLGGTGPDHGGDGSKGRIRIECFRNTLTAPTNPTASLATPGPIFLPPALQPVKVTTVGGVAVPPNPSGGFFPADLAISEAGLTTVELEAQGIPPGTVVQLVMWSETGSRITVDSDPLVGTLESSTASADVSIPSGFSRFFVQAQWTP